MRRGFVLLVGTAAAATLMVAGCGQAAAPPATPTRAPAAAPTNAVEPTKVLAEPTKPAEPTKAPVVAPTAAPAKKVDFPQKGKSISLIVPYAPGGATDTSARLMAQGMEKELGTPVEVANKPGAGSQVGLTELVKSKPDGYTLSYALLPPVNALYLDPRRQAVFGRKDFLPLAMHWKAAVAPAVKSDSPYKSMKDLIDAAKAKPESIKAASTGIGSIGHLAILGIEKATGAKFAPVMFDGDAPATTALLGGHVDATFNSAAASSLLQQVKNGTARVLAIMDKDESEFYPGVKTIEAQGYKLYWVVSNGIVLPAGTPKEVVEILSAAIKKTAQGDEHRSKMKAAGMTVSHLGPDEYAVYWDEVEAQLRPLMDDVIKAG